MIPTDQNRRELIAGDCGRRDAIRALAHGRDQCNFGDHLSIGPFGGVELADNQGVRHSANGDEDLECFVGSFSKGLGHDAATGYLADPGHYRQLVHALDGVRGSERFPDPAAIASIDAVPRAPSVPADQARPFVNPLAAAAAGATGVDSYDLVIPPAPRLGGRQAAIELVELYWMALLRDVPIGHWQDSSLAQQAVAELHALNQVPRAGGEEQFTRHFDSTAGLDSEIHLQRLFRGSAPGDDEGPYVSQFLIKDIPYGTLTVEQTQFRLRSDADYMTTWGDWLDVQNGRDTTMSRDRLEDRSRPPRHIVTLRDLAHYVHFDALHQAYFNAALILDGLGMPLSPVNPYTTTRAQEGFGVLGGPHLLVAVTEAATRALRAVWHQKWLVHRRLRPEAMAGRAEYQRRHPQAGPVDALALNSVAATRTYKRQGNLLLPQAFPEGSPMHPSYGAGHATVAGACTTVLKAFFDTDVVLPNPQAVAFHADGSTRLVALPQDLTVGGELNKLAANIALGRNGAGVHYRTDYTKSMTLGEAVAMALLQEQAMELKEGRSPDAVAFEFENFSGERVEILYSGEIRSAARGAAWPGAVAGGQSV